MRVAEFIFSAIVAFAIVYVILENNKQNSDILAATANGYTITISTIPTAIEDTLLVIPVMISGPRDSTLKLWFRHSKTNQNDSTRLYLYAKTPLVALDADSGHFQATFQTGKRSNVLRYYFEIRDPVGRNLVELKNEKDKPLRTKVIGRVDSWIEYSYLFTMFLAILSITRGAIASIGLVGGKVQIAVVRLSFVWGLLFSFISAILLKTWYGIQLSGDTWLAVPFGIDMKDNLQQVLMIYLFSMIIITSKTKKAISNTAIGYLGILSFFQMTTAYLLPLVVDSISIPVSTISYIFIAVILISTLLISRTFKNA